MTTIDESGDIVDKESPISPWKSTPFGEWAFYDAALEHDPSLIEILKPIDGFVAYTNEFKLKVKINTNGSIVLYRSARLSNTGNGT